MSNDFGGKKRSELPDKVFGIPQERKYPMPDEKHTRSAIKLFNHVEPKYEKQLAKAIIKNMKKYNIDSSMIGPNNRLRKYLPKDMIKECVEYVDYTLMKGAQPPYSTKNHRVYDYSLLEDAVNEVMNEKLNIPKNESYNLNEIYSPQETGISTIIFDIGDVLVSSDFRDCLLQDPDIPNDIVDELINLWIVDKDNIDDTLTLDTYREIVIKRLGSDFSKYIPSLIKDSVDCVLAFDYTIPLIQDLKDRGYKVYYLSNWSAWNHDLLLQAGKFDFLKLMDGGVFSYDVSYRKPDPEIYDILLKKYNINPKKAIFFDDKEENIKAANKLGLNGVVFYDHDPFIVYKALSKKSTYLESNFKNSTVNEYGTTAGTIVGTNQPDSVYIVNYMQNNAFSGHKEPKFGICKKGMKDLHIVGGKYNRFHYVPDLDKFKKEASDIHMYRYKGKPKNEFFDIIEEMKDDNDLDLYKLLTGREIKDRSDIIFDGDFVEEDCFLDEIDAIKACTEAGLLEAATDLHPVPILTESVQGRPYNYYRDLNGVFIQNEITKLRSKSYDSIDEIPDSESILVKRGYLV